MIRDEARDSGVHKPGRWYEYWVAEDELAKGDWKEEWAMTKRMDRRGRKKAGGSKGRTSEMQTVGGEEEMS